MLRFLLCLSTGAALCFLTGCVSLPTVEKEKQRQLNEKDMSKLEGRYAWFTSDGRSYLPLASACSSSVPVDSIAAVSDTSRLSPSPSSPSLDSSKYQIEIRVTDGNVIEFYPYCKDKIMDSKKYTINTINGGYFKADRGPLIITRWFLLPIGGWVLIVEDIQFGLTKRDELIISMAGTGGVFLGGAFPIFGTNWGYLGTHPKVEQ